MSNSRMVYKRNWRQKVKKTRRYRKTMEEFLKIKHVNIYSEYGEFFNILDTENPSARDLTKTDTLKKWKKGIQQAENQETVTLNTYYIRSPEAQQASPIIERAEQEIIENDPLTQAMNDVIQLQAIIDPADMDEGRIDEIVEQIIRDLEGDEDVNNILNSTEDEGIGLNADEDLENVLIDYDGEFL